MNAIILNNFAKKKTLNPSEKSEGFLFYKNGYKYNINILFLQQNSRRLYTELKNINNTLNIISNEF
ncbi:hypothetical protein DI383_13460 [Flavobacteriaceae bacterium LYZ1037]|nr:hypothetical protein DI383_13460 [Flavobacteriaceae bacterium LYZ1037]